MQAIIEGLENGGLSSDTAVQPRQRRVVMNAIGQAFAVSVEVDDFLGIGGREVIVRLISYGPTDGGSSPA